MVAGCRTNKRLLERVARIYKWLDAQIHDNNQLTGQCKACGKCCDFGEPAPGLDQVFDHRLFITPPELMYLTAMRQAANLGAVKIKPMPANRCPYNVGGKCTVYEYRFAGCRIFYCNADVDFQSKLSESSLEKFKFLCAEFQIPYHYIDLATALNT
jgi:Fe-S-cluster containining protein